MQIQQFHISLSSHPHINLVIPTQSSSPKPRATCFFFSITRFSNRLSDMDVRRLVFVSPAQLNMRSATALSVTDCRLTVVTADQSDHRPASRLQAAAVAGDNINSRLPGGRLNCWAPAASAIECRPTHDAALCTVHSHAQQGVPPRYAVKPLSRSRAAVTELRLNIVSIVLPLNYL